MPFVDFFYVPAGGATIETLNLSTGGDTVLHAFLMPAGTPIAGNDDIPFSGTMRSLVTIPAGAANRWVRAFVRSFGSNSVGTCSLKYSPVGGTAQQTDNMSFGGAVTDFNQFGDLSAATQIQTAEQPGGASDTMIIVISGSDAGNAIAFDDDSGVAAMSSLRTSTTCSSCRIAVGAYPGTTTGPTAVYIDEDVAKYGGDNDGDGLGFTLEQQVLGTSASATDSNGDGVADGLDSDGDGIADGIEVYGADSSPIPMKLAAWGADPTLKDIFVEADWVLYCPDSPNCSNPNRYQLPLSWVQYNAQYYAPDFRLHVDNGIANNDPATRTLAGAWGGASMIPSFADPGSFCDGRESSFRRVFHPMIMVGLGDRATGVGGQTAGCSKTGWDSLQHELGHQLGLSHGGADNWNCKPHYRSPMSYAFLYDTSLTQFSRGQRVTAPLNPTAVNESAGFGTGVDASYLPTSNFQFSIKTSVSPVAIDWNRDGIFATTTGRGATMWPAGWTDCGLTFGWSALGNVGTTLDAAWVAGSGPDVYVAAYESSTGMKQKQVTKASMDTCYANPSTPCATWGSETAIATQSTSFTGPPRIINWSSRTKLMLTYPIDEGSGVTGVWYQTRTQSSGWSTPTRIVSASGGAYDVIEDATNDITLFSANGGSVYAMHFNEGTSTWGVGAVQKWSDSTNLTTAPSDVTMGYEGSTGTRSVYGLFTDSAGSLILASWNATTNTWTKFSDSIWANHYRSAVGRPTLVYVPFSTTTPSSGRFYVAFSRQNGQAAAEAMTEGNDSSSGATNKRLIFGDITMLKDEWFHTYAGDTLKFTYDAAQDQTPHLLLGVASSNSLSFAPVADGTPNITFYDYDDYAIIRSNLAGSLAAIWP
jgi:hypothetical protein